MKRFFPIGLAALIAGTTATTGAQDLSGIIAANLDFDAKINAQLDAARQQLNAQQMQTWQSVLRDPAVQAAYQQHLAQGGQYPYEQFAYWYAMTAGGTNVQGAVDAQRRQFEGWQQANRTIQEGNASYNQSWQQNQDRMGAAMQRYDDGAINGDWYYQNPNTGENHTLPYTSGPGYFTSGNDIFYKDASGRYYVYGGNAWTPMNMIDR